VVFVLVLLCRRLFVFFFFMTWFAVFMQLKYPILRIFGEEIEESFWLEGPEVYERYLPGRAEV
jgi:hypothetical protein